MNRPDSDLHQLHLIKHKMLLEIKHKLDYSIALGSYTASINSAILKCIAPENSADLLKNELNNFLPQSMPQNRVHTSGHAQDLENLHRMSAYHIINPKDIVQNQAWDNVQPVIMTPCWEFELRFVFGFCLFLF